MLSSNSLGRGHRVAAVLGIAMVSAAILAAQQTRRVQGPPKETTRSFGCRGLPNGGFQSGFSGWTLDPSFGGFGDYNAAANAQIADLSSLGYGEDMACLQIYADSAWNDDNPSGSASQAQMAIRRTAVVSGRFLELEMVGSWDNHMFADAETKYVLRIVVDDGAGNVAQCTIFDDSFELGYTCSQPGIGAIGVCPWGTVSCDLAGSGIQVGDTVTVEILWSASVNALDECDVVSFGGSCCVDELRFCDTRSSSATLIVPIVTTSIIDDPEASRSAFEPQRDPVDQLLWGVGTRR